MTGWKWQRREGLAYLTIPEWSEAGVLTAFTGRNGGVSQGPYASLNMALHVEDNSGKVLQNRQLFLAGLGYELEDCVCAEQVHGRRVAPVTALDRGLGMLDLKNALPECDGMVTSDKIGLLGFYADCAPIYFYHPKIAMVGLAHAGWKGTAAGIVREVVAKIKSAGGQPEDCWAAIGPCIGSCCYEVGENVVSVFRENFNDQSMFRTAAGEKHYLDLIRANRMLLVSEGIRPENIWIAGICTACNPDSMYSYRRDGLTGRMAALIIKLPHI